MLQIGSLHRRLWLAILATAFATSAVAGVLPEDRADLMYHNYNGGNVTVDGPSLLVRKKLGESVSVSGNYYIDMVTSASIDVEMLSGASTYEEERTQKSLSVDYLRGKTTYNLAYINSKESDYEANTASFGISEDMFGDLTTVSLGFTRAWDKVYKNVEINGVKQHDATYGEQTSDHRSYRLGLSQILTKHLIVSVNYESQTHQGQLANPYRAIRFLNNAGIRLYGEEKYPGTRTTNAVGIDARYYMPYRAAVHGSYRYFVDTWGIAAHTGEIGYTHPWREWTFEGSYRYHKQSRADFFGDLFPRANFQNFMARDRNLATMKNQTIHVGATYDLTKIEEWTRSWLNKGTLNLYFDHFQIDFADFRDFHFSDSAFTASPVAIGSEPFYTEDANVIRFFVSVWF